jgi:hypothetical protein
MGSASSRVRRAAATLAVIVLLLVPVAASADAGEIHFPPGAPTSTSVGAEIHVPPGFWDAVLLVWLAAKIGPPLG